MGIKWKNCGFREKKSRVRKTTDSKAKTMNISSPGTLEVKDGSALKDHEKRKAVGREITWEKADACTARWGEKIGWGTGDLRQNRGRTSRVQLIKMS